jgi:hypothetical protein
MVTVAVVRARWEALMATDRVVMELLMLLWEISLLTQLLMWVLVGLSVEEEVVVHLVGLAMGLAQEVGVLVVGMATTERLEQLILVEVEVLVEQLLSPVETEHQEVRGLLSLNILPQTSPTQEETQQAQ